MGDRGQLQALTSSQLYAAKGGGQLPPFYFGGLGLLKALQNGHMSRLLRAR